jgi:hypothetical protein
MWAIQPGQAAARRANQGAAFAPTQISGLVADWDVRALSLNDDDAISSLTDTYGGYHATGTTTQRPTYKANILNGKPVARFNGTANGLVTSAINLSGTSAITLFVVGNSATSGADHVFVEMSSNYNSQADSFLFYRASTNQYVWTHIGNVAGADTFLTTDGTAPRKLTTTPRVLCGVYDKSQAAAAEVTGYRGHMQFGTRTGASNNTNNYGNRALYIGARNQASLFLNGDIARILLYSRALTEAERWLVNTYLGRTFGLEPQSGMLIFDGDSLTYGATVGGDSRAANPYPSQVITALTNKYAWENYAVGGQQWTDMTSDATTQIDPMRSSSAPRSALVVWAGTNDMGSVGGNQSAATTYSRLQTYCNARRSAGFTIANNAPIFVLTCLPRGDAGAPGDFETKRQSYNTLIRAGDSSYDYVIDVAADSRIGDSGDQNDTTYYASDKIHLIEAGYGVVAGLVTTALQTYAGIT